MAHTAYLVCLVSTVSGHHKNTFLKASASNTHKTKHANKSDGLIRQEG